MLNVNFVDFLFMYLKLPVVLMGVTITLKLAMQQVNQSLVKYLQDILYLHWSFLFIIQLRGQ